MSIKSSIKSFTKSSLIKKIFTNIYLLYFVSILAFVSIVRCIMMHKFNTVAFFILVFLLTKHFSNNMIIVLLISLTFTYFFPLERLTREGMENDEKTENEQEVNENKEETITQKTPLPVQPTQVPTTIAVDEPFQVGDQSQKHTYEVDHASTMKQAYSDISKNLGPDGIKKLADETKDLLEQQAHLGEAIKNMEPLIAGMAPLMKSAQGIFGSLGLGNSEEMATQNNAPSGDLSSLLAMAQKLGGSSSATYATTV